MGTVFTVLVEDAIAPTVVDGVFAWWRTVEDRFSTFRDSSEISRLGRGELSRDDAHPDVRHVLAMCDEISRASEGRFSIRPERTDAPVLDPAGFVKGWSVDEAALMLQLAGAEDFIIYAGGDVLCAGEPAEGGAWRVGIRHPVELDGVVAAVAMDGGAIATSAAYERGDHIWGDAAGEALSVSVVGPSLGMADALATALYADGARSLDWLVGGYPDYSVVIVTPGNEIHWSRQLHGRIELGGEHASA